MQSISSDHYISSLVSLLFVYISLGRRKPKSKYVFDFSKADYCSFLLDVDFSVCLQSNDIEFIWAMIKSVLYHAMCLYIPKISIQSRPNPPCFSAYI